MLTSFFGKSSPLNFLILSLYVLVLAFGYFFKNFDGTIEMLSLGEVVLAIILVIGSLFLTHFTIKKNGLTLGNSFGIVLLSALLLLFPAWIFRWEIVVANGFMLLALRRIFSLKSPKNTERKILDASLWIALASFFSFWSILLLFALWISISIRSHKRFRYFMIPFVAMIGMFLVTTAFYLFKEDNFSWMGRWMAPISLDFMAYKPSTVIVAIAFVASVFIWSLSNRFKTASSIIKKERPNYNLVLYVFCICLVMALFTEQKDTGEFLFFMAPMAIIMGGFIEKPSEIWFKELLLWSFMLLPVIFLFV
ncbi:MAG: hypothetical protein K0U54_12820 [Bacteroidetes bacterium]|nr:hypothetical protein [Bacteroidota bacterium]